MINASCILSSEPDRGLLKTGQDRWLCLKPSKILFLIFTSKYLWNGVTLNWGCA